MRNLEILTHFRDALSLSDPDETIFRVCMDEFSKAVFVYTSKHTLYGFKYGAQEGESITINEMVYKHSMADEHPAVEESQVIQMDYIQEL